LRLLGDKQRLMKRESLQNWLHWLRGEAGVEVNEEGHQLST
jgi:hypothetical protein